MKKGGRARGVRPMYAQLLLRAGKNVKRLKRLKRELTLKKFKLRKRAEDLVQVKLRGLGLGPGPVLPMAEIKPHKA